MYGGDASASFSLAAVIHQDQVEEGNLKLLAAVAAPAIRDQVRDLLFVSNLALSSALSNLNH